MDNRYSNIKTQKNNSGKKVTLSVLYPPILKSTKDIYVITTVGDRMDVLAKKYYGHVSRWWIIAEANAVGKGTLELPIGTQLRIPKDLSKIIDDFNKLNYNV